MTNYTEDTTQHSGGANKRPQSLVVLLALSAVNIIAGLYGSINTFFVGPLSELEMEESMAELYKLIAQLETQGATEKIIAMTEQVLSYSGFVNSNSFYLNATIGLITLLIGIASIYLMYNLRKLGFHVYVLYSVLPVIAMYLVAPASLVPNLFLAYYMAISVIFALLYARHLKIMR